MLDQPRNSTNYNVPGTDTFRLGSRMLTLKLTRPPRLGKCGSNLQNIEKSLRVVYIPDTGKIFVQVDQSGAEALIVAYLCRHGNFRDLFIHGVKPHCYVALHVFAKVWEEECKNTGANIRELCDTPVQQLTANPHWKTVDKVIRSSDGWPSERRYYYISKQICHASNYGMKAGMFQLNTLEKSRGKIVISKKDAEYYLSTYHGLFPEIHHWHFAVLNQLSKTRTLYNLFGHPREFWYPSEEPPEQLLNKAYAFIPQSTVGTITNIAYTRLQGYIESNNLAWDLLANTHDSYLVQCPIGEEREAATIMSNFINMEMVAPSDGTKFKMKSEAQAGYNWCPAGKDKNLNGLREIVV